MTSSVEAKTNQVLLTSFTTEYLASPASPSVYTATSSTSTYISPTATSTTLSNSTTIPNATVNLSKTISEVQNEVCTFLVM